MIIGLLFIIACNNSSSPSADTWPYEWPTQKYSHSKTRDNVVAQMDCEFYKDYIVLNDMRINIKWVDKSHCSTHDGKINYFVTPHMLEINKYPDIYVWTTY